MFVGGPLQKNNFTTHPPTHRFAAQAGPPLWHKEFRQDLPSDPLLHTDVYEVKARAAAEGSGGFWGTSRFSSPNSGYTEGVLTVRVKAGFDQGTLSDPVVSSA